MQTTWHIDPVSGSDEATGLSGAPIKTGAEFVRRFGPDPYWGGGEYHIYILGDLPATDMLHLQGRRPRGTQIFLHSSTTPGAGRAVATFTGAIDSLVTLNRTSTPQRSWEITANAITTSWTAQSLVGQRIRLTSGTNNGAMGWSSKDLGSKTTKCSAFIQADTFTLPWSWNAFSKAPAAANTFVVERLNKIPNLVISLRTVDDNSSTLYGVGVVFDSLDVGHGTFGPSSFQTNDIIAFDGCIVRFLGGGQGSGVCILNACRITSVGLPDEGVMLQIYGGYCDTTFGSSHATLTNLTVDSDFMVEGRNVFLSGHCFIYRMAVFHAPASIGALRVTNAIRVSFHQTSYNTPADGIDYPLIWGDSEGDAASAGAGVQIDGGNLLNYNGLLTGITIKGATSDFVVANQTSVRAYDNTIGQFTDPRACSWANLAQTVALGGFGGRLWEPIGNTSISADIGGEGAIGQTQGSVLQIAAGGGRIFGPVNVGGGANFVTGRIPIANVELGATNTVLWSNGSANSFTGAPILSTSLQVGTAGSSYTIKQYDNGGGPLANYMAVYAGTSPAGTPQGATNYSYLTNSLAGVNSTAQINAPDATGFVVLATGGATRVQIKAGEVKVNRAQAYKIYQDTPLGDTTTFDLTIEAQAPTGPTNFLNPGNLIFNIPAPLVGGVHGFSKFSFAGTVLANIGRGGTTTASLFLGSAAPVHGAGAGVGNYVIAGDGSTVTNVNVAPGGAVNFCVGNNARWQVNDTELRATSLQAALLVHNGVSTDVAPFDFKIRSSAPVAGATNFKVPGNLVLEIPAHISGSTAIATIKMASSGVTILQFGEIPGALGAIRGRIYPGGVVPGLANYIISSSLTGDQLVLNAPDAAGEVKVQSNSVEIQSWHPASIGFFNEAFSLTSGTGTPSTTEVEGSLYVQTGAVGDIFLRRSGAWLSLVSGGSGFVPTSRQIIAGAGMTGGGDLSADRTLNVIAHADGSIVVHADDVQVGVLATDAQHGVRGGGTQHAAVTNAAAGFAVAITAANRVLLSTSGTAAVWGQVDLGTMASAGAANTVLWSNGTTNSFTGSPTLSTSLSVGTNPAATGAIRIANNAGLFGRNAANSVDITLVSIDVSNNIVIGTSGNAVRIPLLTTGVVHADVTGILSSSLIVNADITTSTITASKLNAGGTANRVLITTDGTNTSWGQVNLSSMVTGALTLAGDVTGTSAASTVVGLTGVANVVTHHGTTITAAGTELIYEQTGDSLGGSKLSLRNRSATRGAVLFNLSTDVCELILAGTSNNSAIRLEGRGGSQFTGAKEFQLGTPGDPALVIGALTKSLWLANTSAPSTVPSGGGFIYEKSGGVYHKGASQLTTTMGATGSSPLITPTFKDTRIGSVITNAAGTSSTDIITIDFAADYPGTSTGRWTWTIKYTVIKMDTTTHATYTYCRMATGGLSAGGLPQQDGIASDIFNANGCTSTPGTETVQASPFGGPGSSLWAIIVTDLSVDCKWFAEAQIFIGQI